VGATAQEAESSVQVGVGVICDTPQQLERFIALNVKDGSAAEVAVDTVNIEARDDHACGAVAIAFIPGKRVNDVEVEGGTMRVIEVIVVATLTPHGLVPIQPMTQYTAFFVKSEAV
jgi:hypothetical protein